MASDAAHIGLAYNPPVDPRLRCRASRKHPVCLLAARDHALARRRAPLTIADILPYPFALMSAPYGLRQAVDLLEFTERIHLTPSPVSYTHLDVYKRQAELPPQIKQERNYTGIPARRASRRARFFAQSNVSVATTGAWSDGCSLRRGSLSMTQAVQLSLIHI